MHEPKRLVILDVKGERFFCTSRNKKCLEEKMTSMQKVYPTVTFAIKNFFANIKRVSDTGVVTDWTKEEGFSLWYSPVDALSATLQRKQSV